MRRIARIYNEGIEGRSTFETEPRTAADIEGWLASPTHPVLVGERAGRVVGWARWRPTARAPATPGWWRAASTCSRVSVDGVSAALVDALCEEAERAGFHKIVGRLFADNESSRRLVAKHGFREVGTHLRHGRLDGDWRMCWWWSCCWARRPTIPSRGRAGSLDTPLVARRGRGSARASFPLGLLGREHNLGARRDGALKAPSTSSATR